MTWDSWPALLESVPKIREHIFNRALRLGLEEKTSRQLGLVLEEVAVNIVRYAYPEGKAGEIAVSVETDPSRLVIHVMDSGIPFDATKAIEPDILAPVADRPIGGLGILLVRRLVDEMAYDRDGGRNHLVLIRSLKRREKDAR